MQVYITLIFILSLSRWMQPQDKFLYTIVIHFSSTKFSQHTSPCCHQKNASHTKWSFSLAKRYRLPISIPIPIACKIRRVWQNIPCKRIHWLLGWMLGLCGGRCYHTKDTIFCQHSTSCVEYGTMKIIEKFTIIGSI